MSPERSGNGAPAPPPDAELSLRVFAENGALVWELTNRGDTSVRLWQQSNSWGWPMPRLHVEPDHELRPAARLWTRNFPSSVEVTPQKSARYALRAGDFDPETLEPLRDRWQEPLQVQPELRCDPSAEAVEHGVWVGTLRGQQQELSPPHAWLRP